MMRSALITGGTGFLGRAITRRLIAGNVERICVYSRGEYAQANMRAEFKDDQRLRFFIGDVRDRDRLERAISGVEVVIHAAALKRIEVGAYCPEEMIKTNVLGAMNVIEAARAAGVKKAVLVSTDKAFQPMSPYGLSKALAEQLFAAANDYARGPRYVVCRYGNVAGSTGSVIPTWRAAKANGQRVKMTDPEVTRFWMTIDGAVDVVMKALDYDPNLQMAPLFVPLELRAYRLGDLAQALGVDPIITGLPQWEKKHESLMDGLSSDRAPRMSIADIREELAGVSW